MATAIVSAFEPEWRALRDAVADAAEERIAGTRYVAGTIDGRRVLLFLTGMSMVNAAMTIERAIGRYAPARLLFSGIAGALDPALGMGDVVVPERWGQPLECTVARETAAGFAPPRAGLLASPADLPGFGALFPREVEVPGAAGPAWRRWFEADAALLAAAHAAAATVTLDRGAAARPAAVHVGGAGVSGPAFVDNAAFRDHLHAGWRARIVDMESAAAAQVAFAHGLPFLALRSVSDLAGAEADVNAWERFAPIAARNAAAFVRALLRALPADTN